MKKNKSMCSGCYNDEYNHGLGGAKECWSFESATVKLQKEVHINQMPPWKQKPEKMLSCFNRPQWVYVDGDKEY